MGSLTEAKFYGIPVLGIPMFGDQEANMDKAVSEEWAIKIKYSDLSQMSLLNNIKEIIGESR